MSKHLIMQLITAVHRRIRRQHLSGAVATGLLFASVMALLFVGLCMFAGLTITSPYQLSAMTLAVGVVSGGLISLLTSISLSESAKKIDSHHHLKDRMLTAYHILSKSDKTPIEQLQIDDATVYAEKVAPKIVIPFRMPRELPWAIGLNVLALLAAFYLPHMQVAVLAHAGTPHEEIVAITDQLKNELVAPLEEMARENPDDKPIQELNLKVKELIQKLEKTSSDPKESLATLSQIERAVNQVITEFNLEAMEGSLQEIAEAFAHAEATKNAGEAMKQGDYPRAAEEMEKSDIAAMTRRERQTVSDQLKKATDSMNRRKQLQLAQLTEKLADQLEAGDCQGCKNTMCELGGTCCKHCSRKGMCQKLDCQLATLSQCKGDCASCSKKCANAGGASRGDSGNPGSNPGTETGGNPLGDQSTKLDANRDLKEVTGMIGDEGNSEFETIRTTEAAKETSDPKYRETYQERRKAAESVLESEQLPLEQREVIRRYFESIRPTETQKN